MFQIQEDYFDICLFTISTKKRKPKEKKNIFSFICSNSSGFSHLYSLYENKKKHPKEKHLINKKMSSSTLPGTCSAGSGAWRGMESGDEQWRREMEVIAATLSGRLLQTQLNRLGSAGMGHWATAWHATPNTHHSARDGSRQRGLQVWCGAVWLFFLSV